MYIFLKLLGTGVSERPCNSSKRASYHGLRWSLGSVMMPEVHSPIQGLKTPVLGSFLADVILTDVRFLDVVQFAPVFQVVSRDGHVFPVLDVFWMWIQRWHSECLLTFEGTASLTSPKAWKGRKKRQRDRVEKASTQSVEGERSRRSTGTLDAFAFWTLFRRSMSIPKASKRRTSVKLRLLDGLSNHLGYC